MPRLSDSMVEGTIARWLVSDGDAVRRGEEIVEIDTDKTTLAFEAESAGAIRLLAAAGETLPVGASIASIEPVGEAGPEPTGRTAPTRQRGAELNISPLARRLAAQLGVEVASLVGSGPGGRILRGRRGRRQRRAAAAGCGAAAAAAAGIGNRCDAASADTP